MKTITAPPTPEDLGIKEPKPKEEPTALYVVYKCFQNRPGSKRTLDQLQSEINRRFNLLCRETSISARIRQLNGLLRAYAADWEIKWEYYGPNKRNTRYWLQELD